MPWPLSLIPGSRSATIEVGPVRTLIRPAGSRVACRVAGRDVWFESADARLAAAPEAIGSAFLAPALHAGRLLHVEAEVCGTWAAKLPALTAIFRDRWYPHAPGAFALATATVAPAAAGTAVCFSGGVDSLHTLLAGGHPIDTLVHALGYDVKLKERARCRSVERSVRAVAAETGTRAVVVRTNLRRHPLVRATPWLRSFSGAIAALGHLLGHEIGHLVTSSDGLGHPAPEISSGPDTDPLHGSAAVRVTYAWPHALRFDKLVRLAGEG